MADTRIFPVPSSTVTPWCGASALASAGWALAGAGIGGGETSAAPDGALEDDAGDAGDALDSLARLPQPSVESATATIRALRGRNPNAVDELTTSLPGFGLPTPRPSPDVTRRPAIRL